MPPVRIETKQGLIAEQIAPQQPFGWASFNGDDSYVCIQYNGNIIKIPLVQDGDTIKGDFLQSEELVQYACFPRVFRIGTRVVELNIHVSTNSLNFNQVNLGRFAEKTLIITNTGNYKLTIDSFQLTDNTNFSHNGTHCTIEPGSSIQVNVRFKPVEKGVKSATLSITSDDRDTPVVRVTLSGEGTAGNASLDEDWYKI
mgnify:CR=1 FL=1